MKMKKLRVPSNWGRDLEKIHISSQDSKSLVVCFPGKNYSCERPLLHYSGNTAGQSGFDLLMPEYGYQAARTELKQDEVEQLVDESVQSIQLVVHSKIRGICRCGFI